jgi:hypothetical protein
MRLNLILLAIAGALIGTVIYRMGIIQVNRRFCLDLVPNLLLALGLMFALYRWGGGVGGIKEGAFAGLTTTLRFLPLLVIVFWAVGEGSVLIELHKPWVRAALAGKHGIVGAFIAAAIMPSSMTGLPIVADLWEGGADKTVLITFVVVSSLIGMQIVLFRQPYLGWEITGIYLGAAFTLSVFFAVGAGIWRLKF